MQLICPLCGKFNSLHYFDPSSYERDVLGVHTIGLGRGRGTRVIGKLSLLDDAELMGAIRDRCSLLVEIIDGKSSSDNVDVAHQQEEIEGWRRKALDMHKERNDLEMKLAEMEINILHSKSESTRLERLINGSRSKIAALENNLSIWQSESRRWQEAFMRQKKLNSVNESNLVEYERIVRSWMNNSKHLEDELSRQRSRNSTLERRLLNAQEEVRLAEDYVTELLWTINSSADEEFDDLAEAVEYLLEMG